MKYLGYSFDGEDVWLSIAQGARKPRSTASLECLSDCDLLITYGTTHLIDHCRRRGLSVRCEKLIDIAEAHALLLGGGGIRRRQLHTTDPYALLAFGGLDCDGLGKETAERVVTGLGVAEDDLHSACVLIRAMWVQLENRLKEAEEWDRFLDMEQPTHGLMLRRQYYGIAISEGRRLSRIEANEKERTSCETVMRFEYGIIDPNDREAVQNALAAEIGQEAAASLRLDDLGGSLEMVAGHSRLAAAYLGYRRTGRDQNQLLLLGGEGGGRAHPRPRTMGTVTGRILVERPSLQYLRRENRSVVAADDGNVLLYPDFDQFEPSILASLSGDGRLQRDCEEGDLYTPLADELFGDAGARSRAKILFLAFCNGMGKNGLISLAMAASGKKRADCEAIIARFFEKYSELERWVEDLRKQLASRGKIGTVFGNHRLRTSKQRRLTKPESRWVISQVIQGTASVILKTAILDINQRLPEIGILLPMHDALLLQCLESDAKQVRKEVDSLLLSAFKKWCPDIRPRVTFEAFSPDLHEDK